MVGSDSINIYWSLWTTLYVYAEVGDYYTIYGNSQVHLHYHVYCNAQLSGSKEGEKGEEECKVTQNY